MGRGGIRGGEGEGRGTEVKDEEEGREKGEGKESEVREEVEGRVEMG